jgi:hypothetical protein
MYSNTLATLDVAVELNPQRVAGFVKAQQRYGMTISRSACMACKAPMALEGTWAFCRHWVHLVGLER